MPRGETHGPRGFHFYAKYSQRAVYSALGLNATPVSQCYPSPWKLS